MGHVGFSNTYFTALECIDLLARVPRLTHCTFELHYATLSPSISTSRLRLTELEDLHLNCLETTPLLLVLDSLALPALRSLKVVGDFRNPDAPAVVHPFLERAPNLHIFDAQFYQPRNGISSTALSALLSRALSLTPLLTVLRLVQAPASPIFELLHLLSVSATFLPVIEKIDCFALSVDWTDSNITTLVKALTSRWKAADSC
ncbi:hypothetical protein B0H16DRAFT_1724000 [Mycena metata]|uniref:Uncharacterized protein n=1 Tax=Mycena metata TaxID=1033252 RepID=A0AAD7IZ33_9AGAR|nr:hypothetical protein B0H16DRAFT_1724000 [Mycena metata]